LKIIVHIISSVVCEGIALFIKNHIDLFIIIQKP